MLLIHIIEGRDLLRAHDGVLYMCRDGCLRAFEGVVHEGTLARVKAYILRFESLFRNFGGDVERRESAAGAPILA